jgi:hypothetical protein
MPIVKIEVKKRTHPFVIIDKRPLNDPRLSWAAKGLLAHLLCKPRDWRLVFANLLKQSPGGRYLLRALLNELKRVGYAKISRIRDVLGRMKGSSWTIYEEPTEMPVYPLSVKPESRRNPSLGETRASEKSDTTNNEYPSNPTNNNKATKSVLAPDGERELLGQIAGILGEVEMEKNGGMWRKRIRRGPAERRALRNTIEDYRLLTPDQRNYIRNRAAWFTDRYQRNLVKVDAARADPPVKTANI